MTASPERDPQAERLLKALEQHSDLTCAQAQVLLPALVEAEFSGADADALPHFRLLLGHLDTCEAGCVALYADLSEKLAALANPPAEPAPAPRPAGLLDRVRQSERVVLSVLRQVPGWFQLELRLQLPAYQPVLSTHGSALVFGDTLAEVEREPEVAVSLVGEAEPYTLIAVVQTPDEPTRWEVQLTAGATVRSTATDPAGVARFEGLAGADLQQPTLTAVLLDEPSSAPDSEPAV